MDLFIIMYIITEVFLYLSRLFYVVVYEENLIVYW